MERGREVAVLVDAVRAEAEARAAVARAERELRENLERQRRAVGALRDEGRSYTWIAFFAARALGDDALRDRLAARFRQRASRVTRRHATVRSCSPRPLPSEEGKEATMARVIRRRVTEEWINSEEEVSEADEYVDTDEDDVEETEDDSAAPTRKPSRRR